MLSKQPEVIAATTAAQEATSDELPSPNDFPQAASGRSISSDMDELRIAPTEDDTAEAVPGNGGNEMPPTVSPKAAALAVATAVSATGTQETIAAAENDSEARKDNCYGDHAEMLAATPGLKDSGGGGGDLVELDELSRDRKEGGKRKLWRQRLRRLFRRDRLDGTPSTTVGIGEAVTGRSETSLGEDR